MAPKITQLINSGRVSFSIEVTPDVEMEELDALEYTPEFVSITWHAQTHQCKDLNIAPLKLATDLKNKGKNVLLHLSCSRMRIQYLDSLLVMLREKEINNLFIILGDCFEPSSSDFHSTQELITYIRRNTEDYFCIGVAGFPDEDGKLLTLKEKVDSGADFILTQAFFEQNIYLDFLIKCQNIGITVPVIAGMFPFETESELLSFGKFCKVQVNEAIVDKLKIINGITIVQKLILDMTAERRIDHFHLFTLNNFVRITNLLKNITLNYE